MVLRLRAAATRSPRSAQEVIDAAGQVPSYVSPTSSAQLSRMMRCTSSGVNSVSSSVNDAGSARPSPCGQSEPNRTWSDSDRVGQAAEVVFVVRRDPHVLLDRVERVLDEEPRRRFACFRSIFSSGYTQSEPFSMLADAQAAGGA